MRVKIGMAPQSDGVFSEAFSFLFLSECQVLLFQRSGVDI